MKKQLSVIGVGMNTNTMTAGDDGHVIDLDQPSRSFQLFLSEKQCILLFLCLMEIPGDLTKNDAERDLLAIAKFLILYLGAGTAGEVLFLVACVCKFVTQQGYGTTAAQHETSRIDGQTLGDRDPDIFPSSYSSRTYSPGHFSVPDNSPSFLYGVGHPPLPPSPSANLQCKAIYR